MIGLLNRLTLGFASAGLAISIALTVAHRSNVILPCGGGNGCDLVARDAWATILGLPVSLIGGVGYLALVVCSLFRLFGRFERVGLQAGLILSWVGMLVSGVMTYHSIATIHATRIWCLSSAGTMTVLAVLFALLAHSKDRTFEPTSGWIIFLLVIVPTGAVTSIAVVGSHRGSTYVNRSIDLNQASFSDVSSVSRFLGDRSAPIVIAEFGDLMCEACREMHPRILSFQSKHRTKVAIAHVPFPLTGEKGHELSRIAADMSERLSDHDYWSFVDGIYGSIVQPDKDALNAIFSLHDQKLVRSQIEASKMVQRAIALGTKYGVYQTPTYILFIDGKAAASATSANLVEVISQPRFASIITGSPAAKG